METRLDGRQVATAQSMTAGFSTPSVSLKQVGQLAIHTAWTGTPQGTFTIEVSLNRREGTQGNFTDADGTWIALATSQYTGTIPAVAGAAGAFLIIVAYSPFRRIRVTWVPTSSTGAANIWINGQG